MVTGVALEDRHYGSALVARGANDGDDLGHVADGDRQGLNSGYDIKVLPTCQEMDALPDFCCLDSRQAK
jgi:hypothetical protein